MESESDDSELSFHINSTYCSSSESDDDCSRAVFRQKNLRINSSNPSAQGTDFIDNPVGLNETSTQPSKSRRNLTKSRDESVRASLSGTEEKSMLATSCQYPAHVPNHSIISPLVPKLLASPRRLVQSQPAHSAPAAFNPSTESLVSEVRQLRASLMSSKSDYTSLQAENERLYQQVHDGSAENRYLSM